VELRIAEFLTNSNVDFHKVKFLAAYPIGDTKIEELPVREIAPAIGYYKKVLGFSVVEFDAKTAKLQRGDAIIGLKVSKEDPEQASVYFSVLNVRQLRREYEDCGICPSQLSEEIVGDNSKIIRFFAKEPYGVCFCFGQKIRESKCEMKASETVKNNSFNGVVQPDEDDQKKGVCTAQNAVRDER